MPINKGILTIWNVPGGGGEAYHTPNARPMRNQWSIAHTHLAHPLVTNAMALPVTHMTKRNVFIKVCTALPTNKEGLMTSLQSLTLAETRRPQ